MPTCGATADNHCCWVKGEVCPHFDPNPPEGAEGHCSLRTHLGSWEAVHNHQSYLKVWPDGVLCGDWVPVGNGGVCITCGWDGT